MNNSTGNCQNCNMSMPSNASFCANCGSKMTKEIPLPNHPHTSSHFQQIQQPVHVTPAHSLGNAYDTPQVRAMIGNNADYYTRQFHKISTSGSSVSWNWPAFLFNWIWMLYRGMTNNPITWVMLGLYILSIITAFIGIGFIISLVCCVISGILGNSWYKKQIDDKLKQMPR